LDPAVRAELLKRISRPKWDGDSQSWPDFFLAFKGFFALASEGVPWQFLPHLLYDSLPKVYADLYRGLVQNSAWSYQMIIVDLESQHSGLRCRLVDKAAWQAFVFAGTDDGYPSYHLWYTQWRLLADRVDRLSCEDLHEEYLKATSATARDLAIDRVHWVQEKGWGVPSMAQLHAFVAQKLLSKRMKAANRSIAMGTKPASSAVASSSAVVAPVHSTTQPARLCSHCGGSSHTADTCFTLHPHLKRGGANRPPSQLPSQRQSQLPPATMPPRMILPLRISGDAPSRTSVALVVAKLTSQPTAPRTLRRPRPPWPQLPWQGLPPPEPTERVRG
jgi:hypothetical protein